VIITTEVLTLLHKAINYIDGHNNGNGKFLNNNGKDNNVLHILTLVLAHIHF